MLSTPTPFHIKHIVSPICIKLISCCQESPSKLKIAIDYFCIELSTFEKWQAFMNKKCFLTLAAIALSLSKLFSNDRLMDQEIKHVVILMLENRSFDNALAWLYENDTPLQFIPNNANPQFLGLSEDSLNRYTNTLKNSSGEIVFSCPPLKGLPSVAGLKAINSPQFDPHEAFPHVTNQIYGFDNSSTPTMLGFLQDYATQWKEDVWLNKQKTICAVMETYTEKELPTLYRLARHYAVSDLWFSSVPTQTNPNRAFTICGTSDGQTVNGALGQSIFHSDTLWNRLVEKSPETTWAIFWQSDMLPGVIKGPASGPKTFSSLKRIPNIDSHFLKIDTFHELARNGQLPAVSFLEPQWTVSDCLDLSNCDFVDVKDVPLGAQGNDLHPPGDVRTGENFVANIYTSLIANPEAWNQTLLVITFDEHGGLFDHVPPPAAVPPDHQFQDEFQFDRLGVRVPTIFISPKIEKKTIVRSNDPAIPFDHTSLISTIFQWRHLDREQWKMGQRAAKAPTFDTVVTLTKPRGDAVLVPDEILLSRADPKDVVQMGDSLCLKNRNGVYVLKSKGTSTPHLGSADQKATLRFACGAGKITHGSFVFIEKDKSNTDDATMLLQADLHKHECSFSQNCHASSQWWTVKSTDHPYVGYEIQYGDKIYLENHIYMDLVQYVPARLCQKKGWFSTYLAAQTILAEGCDDNYWVIERP